MPITLIKVFDNSRLCIPREYFKTFAFNNYREERKELRKERKGGLLLPLDH
jgi:hypothetical protein